MRYILFFSAFLMSSVTFSQDFKKCEITYTPLFTHEFLQEIPRELRTNNTQKTTAKNAHECMIKMEFLAKTIMDNFARKYSDKKKLKQISRGFLLEADLSDDDNGEDLPSKSYFRAYMINKENQFELKSKDPKDLMLYLYE